MGNHEHRKDLDSSIGQVRLRPMAGTAVQTKNADLGAVLE